MNLNPLKLSLNFVSNIVGSSELSKIVADYYRQLFHETNVERYDTTSKRMQDCGCWWFQEVYTKSAVNDLQNINFCSNKFCFNCQTQLAASRKKKFLPEIERLSEEYDMYHTVCTIPNVPGHELEETVKRLFKAFYDITRYFRGDAKIKGKNFSQFGYGGAIRALEIAFNREKRERGMEYHPHLHCILALKKGMNSEDLIKQDKNDNEFSYSYNVYTNKFCNLEVLLQKILYLRYHKEKVNLKSINTVTTGYSVVMKPIDESSMHEVFKYATKGLDEETNFITFDQFKVLENVLYNCRTIQGYGIFKKFDLSDEFDTEVNAIYYKVCSELRAIEEPVKKSSYIQDFYASMCQEQPTYTYITKRTIGQMVKDGSFEATPEEIEAYKKHQTREKEKRAELRRAKNKDEIDRVASVHKSRTPRSETKRQSDKMCVAKVKLIKKMIVSLYQYNNKKLTLFEYQTKIVNEVGYKRWTDILILPQPKYEKIIIALRSKLNEHKQIRMTL